MKIIHVIEALDPAQGGPGVSVPSLAAAQAKLGHEVIIVCRSYPELAADMSRNRDSIPGFDGVVVTAAPRGDWRRAIGRVLSCEFNGKAQRADVVHIHGIWRPFVYVAARASIEHGVKLVVAPRGMLSPWSLAQHRWKKRLALFLGWRRVLDQAFFIHALNKSEKEFIAPLGFRSSICVYPNGVFPEMYGALPAAEVFRSRVPSLGGRRYILFLGRLHSQKGIGYLLEAFGIFGRKNADVDLVFAGPDKGMGKAIEGRADSLGLKNRVHLSGPVYGREKFAAYTGAECFCLPSRQEGFSMAIAEALACGVPVVASEDCHFPEIQEVGAGEIVPLDAQRISDALLSLTTNAEFRRTAAIAARDLMFSRFDWNAIAQDIIDGYTHGCHLRPSSV